MSGGWVLRGPVGHVDRSSISRRETESGRDFRWKARLDSMSRGESSQAEGDGDEGELHLVKVLCCCSCY